MYDLLSPLWENLDRKKKTLRDTGQYNQPPKVLAPKTNRVQNLAPKFPENSRSSSSSGTATKMPSFKSMTSSNSSGSLEMAQRGMRKMTLQDKGYNTGSNPVENWIKSNPVNPKITPSEKHREKNFPTAPSSFNQTSANLTAPIDQSSVANRNGIFRKPSKCDMCRRDCGPLKIFPNAFKNCFHQQLKICSAGLQMSFRKFRFSNKAATPYCVLVN